MIRLIQLETRKLKMKTYLLASVGIFVSAWSIVLMMVLIAHFSPNAEPELVHFTEINQLTKFSMALLIAGFSILGTAMSAKLIIDEYVSKRAILLLTYPVNRKEILTAKLIYTQGFVLFLELICMIFCQIFFVVLKIFLKSMPVNSSLWEIIRTSLAYFTAGLIISAGMSLFSIFVGFIKKSSVVAIVTNVVIIACLGNLVMYDLGITLSAIALLLIANTSSFLLKKRVVNLEI